MQKNNGSRSTKYFLKRSQSSNEGSCTTDFRPSCLKSKNVPLRKFDEDGNRVCTEYSSRDSYQDDAISTNNDSSPLIPTNVPSCHEAHENELFLSTSSSCSLASANSPNGRDRAMANLDSLSLCEDDDCDIPPRISKMNDLEKKKSKSNVKTMYNIKTCSESDNKEMNAAIQVAQNASLCLGFNKKPLQSKSSCGKLSLFKTSHHKEDRKTFSEDIKLRQDYRSTPNEQLTYNELVSKPKVPLEFVLARNARRERIHSSGHLRVRQHSSLSESENLLNSEDDFNHLECLLTSRSDGTEVDHFDELKLFIHDCTLECTCRHKSDPSGVSLVKNSDRQATSCRSLPTSLESNSRTCLERQISTPLPNSSIPRWSELKESESCPPLPTKGGSRSNLSNCENHRSPIRSTDQLSRPSLLKDGAPSCANPLDCLPSFSQETTANNNNNNNKGANASSSPPPPIPSRTFLNSTNPQKGPPLPPKSTVHRFLFRRQTSGSPNRPNSQESDNIEEISSSSESSNFTSSVDSEGLEQYSESCTCRQMMGTHDVTTKTSSGMPFCHSSLVDHSSMQTCHEHGFVEKAIGPIPGRYETSDSMVYDYIGNPSLNGECQHLTEKVNLIKSRFAGVSTNDIECALIENNYSVEKAIEHLTPKNALASTSYNSDATTCLIAPHRHHFVPDPMEA